MTWWLISLPCPTVRVWKISKWRPQIEPIMQSITDWFGQTDDRWWKSSRFPTPNTRDWTIESRWGKGRTRKRGTGWPTKTRCECLSIRRLANTAGGIQLHVGSEREWEAGTGREGGREGVEPSCTDGSQPASHVSSCRQRPGVNIASLLPLMDARKPVCLPTKGTFLRSDLSSVQNLPKFVSSVYFQLAKHTKCTSHLFL